MSSKTGWIIGISNRVTRIDWKLNGVEVFLRFRCIYAFCSADYVTGTGGHVSAETELREAIDLCALVRRSFKEVVAHTHDERLKVKAQAYLEGLDAVDGAVRQDDSIQQP